MYIQSFYVRDFFNMMTRSGIRYVLIKNIDGELPERLKPGKDIDILVHPDEREAFKKLMLENGYQPYPHPLQDGWRSVYSLEEPEYWGRPDTNDGLYIDVCFRLCCRSLIPNTWVPLDESINQDVWRRRIFDRENNWWIMDDDTTLVYLIIRAILDKQEFRSGYIAGIESRIARLERPEVLAKLSLEFFRFTPRLVQMLKERDYGHIIENYITFTDY